MYSTRTEIDRDISQDSEENKVATAEDIKNRIIYQHKRYIELKDENGRDFTSVWRRYGKKHTEEIDMLEKILENGGDI